MFPIYAYDNDQWYESCLEPWFVSSKTKKNCLKLTLKHENFARAYLRTIASANVFVRITFSVYTFYLKINPVW